MDSVKGGTNAMDSVAKIQRLDVTVIVSDPDDPECKVEAKLERCDRNKVVSDMGTVGNVARAFERMLYGD